MLEALFGALWRRSPRRAHGLLSRMAYYICEALCGFTSQNVSCTLLASGEAIAAIQMLDIEAVLAEPELPAQLKEALPPFTATEWKEVLAIARSNRGFIAMDLDKPRWSHLTKAA